MRVDAVMTASEYIASELATCCSLWAPVEVIYNYPVSGAGGGRAD